MVILVVIRNLLSEARAARVTVEDDDFDTRPGQRIPKR
jgi:hypothetical protein